ncbi:hypothetical protein AVEN_195279-1 [Araneus ventricosus]|uniref:Uncharacterized protein n=1 Tax=Araneus ventricosus TaxID=182803 RepID=A0A4Y2FXZ4_ARAVE|nr:hypothetical protein AVEN_195279-1 [Araneus ventricosus]
MSAQIVPSTGRGAYCFRIHGQIYHRTSHLHAAEAGVPKRKRGITGDAASRWEAIRKRERRVVETEEERSRRLSTMAQRGQDRRIKK